VSYDPNELPLRLPLCITIIRIFIGEDAQFPVRRQVSYGRPDVLSDWTD